MANIFKKNTAIGITDELSVLERKKARMLNIICFVWHMVNLGFVLKIVFFGTTNFGLLVFQVVITAALIGIQYLQYRQYYFVARVLLIFLQLVNHFVISNYIYTGFLIEYFYAIIPLISLHFFDRKIVTHAFLLISILLFYVPNTYFHHYPEGFYGHASAVAIFMIVFFNMKNLKKENKLHESLLKSQKNKALKDKNIIDEQRKELAELNRFQSQFFINISHEIRTPLTLILGKSDELKEHEVTKYNKNITNIVDGIDKQSKKIQTIVDDVIDLAKMSTNQFKLNLKETSLSSFLNAIYISFKPFFIQKDILFSYEDTLDCKVFVDIVYLERALNNLIFNAIKYTSEGGSVSLTFNKEDENHVVIMLKDSGVGIPKKDLTKIFERFYQSDNDINKSKGSGIGLAFTKEIIEQLNGSIQVISEEGKGSEFRIMLPIVSYTMEPVIKNTIEPSTINVEKEGHKSIIKNSKKTLLIVDDHKDMRSYIVGLLKQFICLEAGDGVKALSILKDQNHSIDLVITDYMMPKMDGYEFIKKTKEQQMDVPILMLTARADLEGKLNVLRLGLDDYITKPFNKEELRIRISNILANNESRKHFIATEKEIGFNSEEEKFTQTLERFIITKSQDTNFRIEDIVEEFAISKSSLYRKIKMSTGLSPNEFINEVKLQHARNILNGNRNVTLKELSHKVGFKQPSYFSKIYEKRFGVKPIEL